MKGTRNELPRGFLASLRMERNRERDEGGREKDEEGERDRSIAPTLLQEDTGNPVTNSPLAVLFFGVPLTFLGKRSSIPRAATAN